VNLYEPTKAREVPTKLTLGRLLGYEHKGSSPISNSTAKRLGRLMTLSRSTRDIVGGFSLSIPASLSVMAATTQSMSQEFGTASKAFHSLHGSLKIARNRSHCAGVGKARPRSHRPIHWRPIPVNATTSCCFKPAFLRLDTSKWPRVPPEGVLALSFLVFSAKTALIERCEIVKRAKPYARHLTLDAILIAQPSVSQMHPKDHGL
jgi:hypothetical protein